MDYHRLRLALEQYGRDTGFAYVCDSYKRELRNDAKYRQWRRLLDRTTLKSMSPREREALQAMLEIRLLNLKALYGSQQSPTQE